jgi:hypothetical protein
MYSLSNECEPFVEGFEKLKEAYGISAFHDNTLKSLKCYRIDREGQYLTIDFETDDIKLRFEKVHGFNSNIPDVRCSFFYGMDFCVKEWYDYGKCLVMQTDGDSIMIVAEKVIVLD